MPKSIYDRGLLRPADIARLQRVFDEACKRREAHPDSADARNLPRDVRAGGSGAMWPAHSAGRA